MAVRRLLGLVALASFLTLFACTVPQLPPPPSSTTTYTTTEANWGQVGLLREYHFADGECWRPDALRWQLHIGSLLGPPVVGYASLHPNPTIRIESVSTSTGEPPPTFAPLTLADGEGAFTQWFQPIPQYLLTITYRILDTNELVTKTEFQGVGCAVGG